MVDDLVRAFGYLTLGTRLKRLGEHLQADVAALAAAHALPVPVGQFPVLAAIGQAGALTVGDLAETVGFSQPAITRSVAKLVELGLVAVDRRSTDQRRKTVALTPAGSALVARSRRLLWPHVEAAVRQATGDGGDRLLDEINAFEDNLLSRSLLARADALMTASAAVRLAQLDRPIWHALTTRQATHAVGTARARRYVADIAPFAATGDDTPDSCADLADLVATHGSAILLQAGDPPMPPNCRADLVATGVQMLLDTPERLIAPGDVLPLGDADAVEMRALAELTAPGPFAARTHTLGAFFGVRVDGRLVAMAGERMAVDGFTEISGVCTHPDARGQGLAGRLVSRVASGILARGETPFLHAFASNAGAIRLYQALGFAIRRDMTVVKYVPA